MVLFNPRTIALLFVSCMKLLPYPTLGRGKCSIAAESGAGNVGGFNSKMISAVAYQAADIGTDVPVRVPILGLHRSGGAVVGRPAKLETNRRAQPMRIE